MSSTARTFDRLANVDRLKENGVEEKQARAHAEARDAALRDMVATKSDLDGLRSDLDGLGRELRSDLDGLGRELRQEICDVETRLEAKIETSIANLKVEILRWLIVTQIALGGFLLAAIKFFQ